MLDCALALNGFLGYSRPMTANTKAINKVMTAYNNKTVCNWTENQFKSILGFIKGGGADMLLGIPDEMFVEYAPMLALE